MADPYRQPISNLVILLTADLTPGKVSRSKSLFRSNMARKMEPHPLHQHGAAVESDGYRAFTFCYTLRPSFPPLTQCPRLKLVQDLCQRNTFALLFRLQCCWHLILNLVTARTILPPSVMSLATLTFRNLGRVEARRWSKISRYEEESMLVEGDLLYTAFFTGLRERCQSRFHRRCAFRFWNGLLWGRGLLRPWYKNFGVCTLRVIDHCTIYSAKHF